MSSGVSCRACCLSKITFGKDVQPDSASLSPHFEATFLSVGAVFFFGVADIEDLVFLDRHTSMCLVLQHFSVYRWP